MDRRLALLLYFALTVPFGIGGGHGAAFGALGETQACACTVCRRKRIAVAAIYRPRRITVAPQRPLAQYALSFAVRPPPAFLLANP